MKAAVFHGPHRPLAIEEVPTPQPGAGEVLVRVAACGVCHTDLHYLDHGVKTFLPPPLILGHEASGVVAALGPGVKKPREGERVLLPAVVACGACESCRRGRENICDAMRMFGNSMPGAYAEYVVAPARDCVPLPDEIPLEDASIIADAISTPYHAVRNRGRVRPGDAVAVFGCGPVGLVAARSAFLLGATRVVAIDRVEARLRMAERWAGADTIDLRREKDPVTALKSWSGGRGPDVCIDAVGLEASGSALQTLVGRKLKLAPGSAVALDWAIHAVRKGGTVSVVGVYGPPANLVPIGVAMNKGLTLRMAQANVKRYMPHLLEHVRAGRLDGRALITHRLPLERAAKAYELFDRKEDGCVKCVLLPQG